MATLESVECGHVETDAWADADERQLARPHGVLDVGGRAEAA
jgi:hypothetical protein